MSTSFWLILCAGGLGLIAGFLLGCERVSRLRRKVRILTRQLDVARADLRTAKKHIDRMLDDRSLLLAEIRDLERAS